MVEIQCMMISKTKVTLTNFGGYFFKKSMTIYLNKFFVASLVEYGPVVLKVYRQSDLWKLVKI